ncbi:BLUF domain-containing protein [Aurantiacibacter atlanticus]|uniref:BLUF domain-containing protein n=1 Tax=Aurantiacibacter atlanticus TaxID=1648404 RepID=A0A0H4VUZ6_9SPHN|nr:BLUF domain-containing protein [Aurantiacibacter atlanticus]
MQGSRLHQLVYVSTAAKLDEGDIAAILATAQRRNESQEITGFLLYNGRNFLQLVEGDEARLLNLCARLANDPRHTGMVITSNIAIEERAYPDWTMNLIGWVDDVDTRMARISERIGDRLNNDVQRFVLNFAALN